MLSFRNLMMALAVLAATTSSLLAGESSAVARARLNAMGLGGMQTMSAREGQAVRGKGSIAIAFGPGYFQVHNHFSAGTNFNTVGPFFTAGGSFSFAK